MPWAVDPEHVENFKMAMRADPELVRWFSLADDLVELGWEMVSTAKVDPKAASSVVPAYLFIRAHQTTQSATALVERGAIGDARAVMRGAVECAIALNALADDRAFLLRMVSAEKYDALKFTRLLLGSQAFRAGLNDADIARIEGVQADIEKSPASERQRMNCELLPVSWTRSYANAS